jgi:hypothetical protein
VTQRRRGDAAAQRPEHARRARCVRLRARCSAATYLVLRFHVRAVIQQQRHDRIVAKNCGDMQRRGTILCARGRVNTPLLRAENSQDAQPSRHPRIWGGATAVAHAHAPCCRRLAWRRGCAARRTSSFASFSAPRSSRRVTTDSHPLAAAKYSGVTPPCVRPKKKRQRRSIPARMRQHAAVQSS